MEIGVQENRNVSNAQNLGTGSFEFPTTQLVPGTTLYPPTNHDLPHIWSADHRASQ